MAFLVLGRLITIDARGIAAQVWQFVRTPRRDATIEPFRLPRCPECTAEQLLDEHPRHRVGCRCIRHLRRWHRHWRVLPAQDP